MYFLFHKNNPEVSRNFIKKNKANALPFIITTLLIVIAIVIAGYSLYKNNSNKKFQLKNVPIIQQAEQNSCNTTAAAIALKFKGVDITAAELYNKIPKETAKKENGYWGNPNLGFVGNVYGEFGGDKTEGYGVHWEPIANIIKEYRPVEIKQSWNVKDMLTEVEKGNPVITWMQNGAAKPTPLEWKTFGADGKEITIKTVNAMHSEVVIGYIGTKDNPTEIILSDPWADRHNYKYHHLKIERFNELWHYLGNTAVIVK